MDADPICLECGVQYPPKADTTDCAICENERGGLNSVQQLWTSLTRLKEGPYSNAIRLDGPLMGIGTSPRFGMGPRALIVPTPDGNLLWDCVSLLDETTIETVFALGGLAAIAVAHPRNFGTMIEWSKVFGDIPIYVYDKDAPYVPQNDAVEIWRGNSYEVFTGITLYNSGAYKVGGTVAHWENGADGEGVLLSSDTIQVARDTRWVGFMHSYKYGIPEHPDMVIASLGMISNLKFDVVYGSKWDRVVTEDGKSAVLRSFERYLLHLGLSAMPNHESR